METVLWPDRQEFLGYHMTMKAMSRDEAIALWNKDSADPAIEKRGTGSGLRIKVMGIPTSNTITGKRAEGRVDASRAIGNKSELESAAKRLCVGTVSEDFDMLFGRSGRRTGSVSASGPLSIASSAWTMTAEDESNNLSVDYLNKTQFQDQVSVPSADAAPDDTEISPGQPDNHRRIAQDVGQTVNMITYHVNITVT